MFAESLDLAGRIGIKRQTAYAMLGLAMARRDGAEPGWFARLHGAADQALADLGETFEPLKGRLAETDRQRLRAAMGAEAFEADYQAGRAQDLVVLAHQAAQRVQAVLEAQPTGAVESGARAAAVPTESMTVLTLRELDVLKLVSQGLSNQEIA